MNKYEARFLVVDNRNIIFPLGLTGGQTSYTLEQFRSGQANDLIQQLFGQLQMAALINNISYQPIHNEVEIINDKPNNIIVLLLWSGYRAPQIWVSSIQRVLPTDPPRHSKTMRIPSYLYELSLDSQFFFNSSDLFLDLLNRFIETCSEEDLLKFTNKFYLRFMIYQDGIYETPYAYVYFRPISEALPPHRFILEQCPEDMFPGEITSPANVGHFIFFNKNKALSRQVITQNDLQLID